MALLRQPSCGQPLRRFANVIFVAQFQNQARLVRQGGERFKERKPVEATNARHPVAVDVTVGVLQMDMFQQFTPLAYPLVGRLNFQNDWSLQEEYAFSDAALTNHWRNLYVDRSAAIAAISDAAMTAYIRTDNYTPLREALAKVPNYPATSPILISP